jgi:hypothetical protein
MANKKRKKVYITRKDNRSQKGIKKLGVVEGGYPILASGGHDCS